MSQTSNAQLGWFTDTALDRRTVAEIQEKVIEKRGRNMVSQFFHAKDDKETIAGWNADLNRVLQVFTVCSVGFNWLAQYN